MNTTFRRTNRYHDESNFIPLTHGNDDIRGHHPDRLDNDRNRCSSSRENHEDWRAPPRDSDSDPQIMETEFWCGPTRPNRILLVHGLEIFPINCDSVFNLFCLYGNITSVKVLRNGKVLVEMNDVESAKRCVNNLHHLPLDGCHKMKVKYSKHSFIHDQIPLNTLVDGTPAHKVYLTSKLNRFTDNGMCYDRRRVAAPSRILHFFNAPTDVCGLAVHKAVLDAIDCADAISSITILPMKPMAKCSTGLIELKSISLAVRAVLMSNHMTLESTKSKFPFLTKLCFSKWSRIQQTPAVNSAATLRFSSTPRMPWMLHKSEHSIPTTELPIYEMTVVTGGGRGASGDSPWTLWAVKSEESETGTRSREAVMAASSAFTVGSDDDRSDGPAAELPGHSLLDMLRNQLCQRTATVDHGGDAIRIGDVEAAENASSASTNATENLWSKTVM